MSKLNLQAVMIDLDGTLVDTVGDFEVALNRALADVQVPPASCAMIERSIGNTPAFAWLDSLVHLPDLIRA